MQHILCQGRECSIYSIRGRECSIYSIRGRECSIYSIRGENKLCTLAVKGREYSKYTENSLFFMLNMEFVSLVRQDSLKCSLVHCTRGNVKISSLTHGMNSIFNVKSLKILYIYTLSKRENTVYKTCELITVMMICSNDFVTATWAFQMQ